MRVNKHLALKAPISDENVLLGRLSKDTGVSFKMVTWDIATHLTDLTSIS